MDNRILTAGIYFEWIRSLPIVVGTAEYTDEKKKLKKSLIMKKTFISIEEKLHEIF